MDELGVVARQMGRTAAQLALAWVLSRGHDVIPIPGTKRRTCLEENVAAVDVSLTAADLTRIEKAVPANLVAGERYPPALQAQADR